MWLALATLATSAAAEPRPIDARIVWTHGERVYVALASPEPIAAGALLQFRNGKKIVAGAVVGEIRFGEMIVASISSGSLRGVKKPERLRVFAEEPPTRPLPLLRLGCPSPGRATPFVAGSDRRPTPVLPESLYAAEVIAERSYRFVKRAAAEGAVPWPDTLLLRYFDDSADEEIAFERGEIDAAIFWPGEPSPHLRQVAAWSGEPSGLRARGVIAATVRQPGGSGWFDLDWPRPEEMRRLISINEELFLGDLAACDVPAGALAPSAPQRDGPSGPPRYEVDPGCPGHRVLERFLERDRPAVDPSLPSRTVRVLYFDSVPRRDSLDAAVRARAGSDPRNDVIPMACLFTIRCPVVSAPALRPYLAALGTSTLVNLFDGARGNGTR